MPTGDRDLGRSDGYVYRTKSEPEKLLAHVEQIRTLADSEKDALGFMPGAAYRDAIEQRRIIAMCTQIGVQPTVVGFVFFSGVFPNARIQQIVVEQQHRKAGIATALINAVASRLEKIGFLRITAAVASDLPAAHAFYERNGFIARHSRMGGKARGRTIVLRARDLDNESLFSLLETSVPICSPAVDLGLRLRSARQAPLYAIDLNVLFDVLKAKNRPRADAANRLVAAALGHQIRLVIAPEFIVELERTTKGKSVDPILALACQLSRLPAQDAGELDRLATVVHEIVFGEAGLREGKTPQARSDARHLAQAAMARASGYVTSDRRRRWR
jgi:GNAT superfamily N-acetyltransferase/predicted nucleic acid-binding protein